VALSLLEMKMKPSKLKPCPKCGAKSEIGEEGEYFLFCGPCGWMPNEKGYSTRANAVRAWQRWNPHGREKG